MTRMQGRRSAGAMLAAVLMTCAGAPARADDRFAIEGLTLGAQVNFSSAAYRDYRCEPSSQFDGFLWCARRVNTQNRNGAFMKNYTIAHDRSGRAEYINLSFDPAFFNPGEAYAEVQRLNAKFRETAKVVNFSRPGLPNAIIAVWGDIALDPLSPNAVASLALGQSPNAGILVDFIGQLRESARRNLPIYSVSGGEGYIWSASFDARGIGHLRLTAVNPDGLKPPPAPPPVAAPAAPANPPIVATDPTGGEGLSTPDRLEALERLGKLRQSGVLTEDEFNREKQKILGN